MQPQLMQERQPYVRFEERAMEVRDANGLLSAKLVDFAIITPVGTKDVHEKVVSEWFTQMKQLERMERWNPEWTARFKEMHRIWKETNSVPLNGSPVANWPLLSKAQVSLLKGANVLTIEDLAQANEESIGRLGMGGRNLVQLAKNWIEASGSGAATLAARNVALENTNQALREKIEELNLLVGALELKLAARAAHEQGTTPPISMVDSHTLRANQADAADKDLDKILG